MLNTGIFEMGRLLMVFVGIRIDVRGLWGLAGVYDGV